MNSDIREMPGPDVDVNDRAPAQEAPITMPIAAISSSAWMTAAVSLPVTGSFRWSPTRSMNASQSEDDGVIGYHEATVAPPNMQPIAAAALPSMMILPAVRSIRSTRYGDFSGKLSRA